MSENAEAIIARLLALEPESQSTKEVSGLIEKMGKPMPFWPEDTSLSTI